MLERNISKELEQASMEWELSKAPTEMLVAELEIRGLRVLPAVTYVESGDFYVDTDGNCFDMGMNPISSEEAYQRASHGF